MTRVLAVSLAALALVSVVAGLRLGMGMAGLSESDVINRYAARYVAQTGGALTDCFAKPISHGWLAVVCEGTDQTLRYDIGRWGQLLPHRASQGPKT